MKATGVMARMAGTESTAKMTSTIAIAASAAPPAFAPGSRLWIFSTSSVSESWSWRWRNIL